MTKNPTLRILGWVVLFGLLAGLLSCGLAYGLMYKWFVPWHTLPQTPEAVSAVRGATIETVDVETTGKALLRFDILQPEQGWVAVDTPRSESDADCERFLRTRPPADALDQRITCQNYADGGNTTIFALRRDGRISYWSAGDSAYEGLLLFLCPAVAIPVGMGIGLAVGLIRRRRTKEVG